MDSRFDRRAFIKTSVLASAAAVFPMSSAWAQAGRKSEFRWIPAADLSVLDPLWSTHVATQIHAAQVFDTLYGLDEDYQPQPQMAQGHTVSDDGKVWTITLRDGLAFHDGSPVRAADVVASLARWLERNQFGRTVQEVTEKLEAVDDKTLRFTLTRKFPLLPAALARPQAITPISTEALSKAADSKPLAEIVGSGPYRFVKEQWVSGSRVVYEKFDQYVPRPGEAPSTYTAGAKQAEVQRVVWHIIPDAATRIAAIQAGEVDGIESIDMTFMPMLESDPNIELVRESLPRTQILRLNHLHAPFDNPKVRKAILSVVNQAEFMTAAYGMENPDYFDIQTGVFAPASPMASDAGIEAITGPRDLERARQILKEEGYDGQTIVVLDPVDNAPIHSSSLLVADLFKKLGMKVEVATMDWGTYLQRRSNQGAPNQGGWHAAITVVVGINTIDPVGHRAIRGDGKDGWFGWPESERLETLRNEWIDAESLDERKDIARQIQLQVFEDVPYIPLGSFYMFAAVRKDWEGYSPEMPLFHTLRRRA